MRGCSEVFIDATSRVERPRKYVLLLRKDSRFDHPWSIIRSAGMLLYRSESKDTCTAVLRFHSPCAAFGCLLCVNCLCPFRILVIAEYGSCMTNWCGRKDPNLYSTAADRAGAVRVERRIALFVSMFPISRERPSSWRMSQMSIREFTC